MIFFCLLHFGCFVFLSEALSSHFYCGFSQRLEKLRPVFLQLDVNISPYDLAFAESWQVFGKLCMVGFCYRKLTCVFKFLQERKCFRKIGNRLAFLDRFKSEFRISEVRMTICTFRIVYLSVLMSTSQFWYLMGLLFVDVNHFIAFGAFLYVSETIGFMEVNFVSGEQIFTIFALTLFLIVFHLVWIF